MEDIFKNLFSINTILVTAVVAIATYFFISKNLNTVLISAVIAMVAVGVVTSLKKK